MATAPGVRKRARFCASPVTAEDFVELQASHPYGVLPGGNRFFRASGVTTAASPSSSLPSDHVDDRRCCASTLLTDECWNAVLGLVSGEDLGRVGQVSRYLYVAAHQPELWRDSVLRLQRPIARVGRCWKDTYVQLHQQQDSSNAQAYQPHIPMAVSGVYSDYFYRLHSCRSFNLPAAWLEGDDASGPRNVVPKVAASQMTIRRFLDDFERPNQPVVIVGAARSWGAFQKWNDPVYCERHMSDRTFRATSGVAPMAAQFQWKAYRDYCVGMLDETLATTDDDDDEPISHGLLEEGPLYLFDRTALQPGSVFWKDFMPDLQQSCPYWDPGECDSGHDLFDVLGEGRRPDHTWLIVGPQRSGSVFHIDPNGTHAWNAAIVGRKRWIFYPPGVTPPGVFPSADGDEVALPLSIGEWLFQFWDEHCKRKRTAPAHERPLECTAMPGDVLFVPHGWWHMVINLDEINIAITHNYASFSNLSNVLKFLDTKRDQVSGCRDRTESVKPECLYEHFVKLLEQHHPGRLKTALAQPNWTCRAWKDDVDATTLPLTKEQPNENIMEKAKRGDEAGFSFGFL